jgi:hypothetical protein
MDMRGAPYGVQEPNRSALQQGRGGCRDRSEFKNRTEPQAWKAHTCRAVPRALTPAQETKTENHRQTHASTHAAWTGHGSRHDSQPPPRPHTKSGLHLEGEKKRKKTAVSASCLKMGTTRMHVDLWSGRGAKTSTTRRRPTCRGGRSSRRDRATAWGRCRVQQATASRVRPASTGSPAPIRAARIAPGPRCAHPAAVHPAGRRPCRRAHPGVAQARCAARRCVQ